MHPLPPQYRQPTHLVHLILAILTMGLWVPVWILVSIDVATSNRNERRRYEAEVRQRSFL